MQGVLQADAGMQIAVSGKDYVGGEIACKPVMARTKK